VANLQNSGAAFEKGFSRGAKCKPALCQRPGVEDGIKARKSHIRSADAIHLVAKLLRKSIAESRNALMVRFRLAAECRI
jgi:hypothetical protein